LMKYRRSSVISLWTATRTSTALRYSLRIAGRRGPGGRPGRGGQQGCGCSRLAHPSGFDQLEAVQCDDVLESAGVYRTPLYLLNVYCRRTREGLRTTERRTNKNSSERLL
jgi:hypothetical protein